MNDVIVEFARLWGNFEIMNMVLQDEEAGEKMKSYDSEDLLELLKIWADEYEASVEEDTYVFFCEKLIELVRTKEAV